MPIVPLTLACLLQAASPEVPHPILVAILRQEGGRVGEVVHHPNGSVDIGPMQINRETWVPRLSRDWGISEKATEELLRDDGCLNVKVGAWIFGEELKATNGDFWLAVGRYHSRTPWRRDEYSAKVLRHLLKIYGPGVFDAAPK